MVDEWVTVEPQDEKHAGQRILRLNGRLTFPTPGDDKKFLEQIRGAPAPTVILDLSGVISCDSSGVGELMQVHIAFKRENRRLALAATPQKVQMILKVAQVFEYFKVFATVEEAEAALM
jgi:anti-sigma B factor antagonist